MSAPRENRASTSSTGTPMRVSRYEDDDEDAALAAMGISDGFRPPNTHISTRTSRRESMGRRTPPPRPSSTTKPRALESTPTRNDGSIGSSRFSATAVPSQSSSFNRASTVSTASTPLVADVPYHGPTGPSHPYHMYHQGTRPMRTASVATASTFQPSERSYVGPSGPTHPYGLYSQDTTHVVEQSMAASAVPVGFLGRRDEYQRRLGPDGEEIGDIIGPMGHTEQLPPYSQYPTERYGKTNAAPMIIGAGGIGLATRNPEFESREDVHSPLSGRSLRRLSSDSSSNPQLNVAALAASEKPIERRWKQIANRKLGGIVPVWALTLFGLTVVLFAIILGTVLGVLGSHHPPPHHNWPAPGVTATATASLDADQGTVYATITTTLDASALPNAPTGLPPLAVGTFALPISAPFTQQQTCLDNSAMYAAWSCQLPRSMLQVNVSQATDEKTGSLINKITIMRDANMLTPYAYGTQPPLITQQGMHLVKDLQQAQLGPAWFFQIPYNKLVILPEATFSVSQKRASISELHDRDPAWKGVAQIGDRPWFCHWNGTLLETFVYANNTSHGTSSSATVTASVSVATNSPAREKRDYLSAASATLASSNSQTSGAFSAPSFAPDYPQIIKVEERRLANSPQPYCNQMMILGDGSAIPNYDSDGNLIQILLDETESSSVAWSKRDSTEVGLIDTQKRQNNQECTCVWLTS